MTDTVAEYIERVDRLEVRYKGDKYAVTFQMPRALMIALRDELKAELSEVERLKNALRGIRDMPEYDQDDVHRLRNQAGVALGRADD